MWHNFQQNQAKTKLVWSLFLEFKEIAKANYLEEFTMVGNHSKIINIDIFAQYFRLYPACKHLNLRWPRELNALQLQKTHANRKSTSKSRKHFHNFDSRLCKCSQQKQIKNTLQMLTTQPNTFYLQRVSFWFVVGICSMCVVKLTKVFS